MLGLVEAELELVKNLLSSLAGVTMGRGLAYYPEKSELVRFLGTDSPDVLFISTRLPMQMEAAVVQARQVLPDVQLVLVDSAAQPETLGRAMQLGVRECLSTPLRAEDVRGVIERSLSRRGRAPSPSVGTDSLYSFLPARPGVGASILAVQAALSLPTDATHRGLLIDADLEAGMVQFMLQSQNPHSLIEALEVVRELDDYLWTQLISEHGHLDVIQAGNSGDYHPDLGRLQTVLAFVRRQYSTILIDLPGGINRLSTELMQQSKVVFLVTTSEVASLHMARRRWRTLRDDLQLGDRVRLLVNRVEKKSRISMDELASAVGLPVHASFVNDYAEVQKAILKGGRVPSSRPLGQQLTVFAESLFKDAAPVSPVKKHRFLEAFALSN